MALGYSIVAAVTHEAAYPSSCLVRGHIHTLTVSAEMRLPAERAFPSEHFDDFIKALDGIRDELADRPLNEMVAPSSADALGVALWVHQRLQDSFPIGHVEVGFAGQKAEIWPD